MDAKVTKTKSRRQRFRVYLRDGREFPVDAATWAHKLQPDNLIKFFDENGSEVKDVFLRAPDTSAVAPDSSTASPSTSTLQTVQNDVKVLASRVDALEGNQSGLREMIERAVTNAVAAAFAERGM